MLPRWILHLAKKQSQWDRSVQTKPWNFKLDSLLSGDQTENLVGRQQVWSSCSMQYSNIMKSDARFWKHKNSIRAFDLLLKKKKKGAGASLKIIIIAKCTFLCVYAVKMNLHSRNGQEIHDYTFYFLETWRAQLFELICFKKPEH